MVSIEDLYKYLHRTLTRKYLEGDIKLPKEVYKVGFFYLRFHWCYGEIVGDKIFLIVSKYIKSHRVYVLRGFWVWIEGEDIKFKEISEEELKEIIIRGGKIWTGEHLTNG